MNRSYFAKLRSNDDASLSSPPRESLQPRSPATEEALIVHSFIVISLTEAMTRDMNSCAHRPHNESLDCYPLNDSIRHHDEISVQRRTGRALSSMGFSLSVQDRRRPTRRSGSRRRAGVLATASNAHEGLPALQRRPVIIRNAAQRGRLRHQCRWAPGLPLLQCARGGWGDDGRDRACPPHLR